MGPSGAPQGCTKKSQKEKNSVFVINGEGLPMNFPCLDPGVCKPYGGHMFVLLDDVTVVTEILVSEHIHCQLVDNYPLLREDVPDMCQTPRQTFTRILIDSWCCCYRETPQYLGLKRGVSSICSSKPN